MMKTFRGPNGWYVADEGKNGFHYQPSDGGRLTKEEAEQELEEIKASGEAE